jgi:predicted transcriptional regulator
MSTADEIAAAFSKVDELLVAATAAAPAVALLAARAAERGISESRLANHLHLNATVLKWVLRTGPDATTDRSIELDEADDDLAELVLKWARS